MGGAHPINDLLLILINALLINNFVLSYFLGLCPFLGVSGRLDTAFRLGLANIFVMLITALSAWALNTYVLIHAPYLRLISFIVVIAGTVQFIEMVIRKLSPALFRALGIFLPLITTNCAILGLAILNQPGLRADRRAGLRPRRRRRIHTSAGVDGGAAAGDRTIHRPGTGARHCPQPDHRRYSVDGLHGLLRAVHGSLT